MMLWSYVRLRGTRHRSAEVDGIQKLARRVGMLVSSIVSGKSADRGSDEVQLAEAVSDLEARGQWISDVRCSSSCVTTLVII
jgi:hypothetical protein